MEGGIMADLRASGLGGVPKGATADRPSPANIGDVFYNGTLGCLEIYTSQGWVANSAPPAIPDIGTATYSATNKAYNNASASITFTPGAGGGLPNTYRVTSSPGGYTGSGAESPITVSGLQSATAYTFSVTGTNNFGTSASSIASNSITANTVPQAPTIGTATLLSATSASLTFTAGATGGSSITNYKYSTDGTNYTAFSPAQTSSPLTISGLTAGSNYSFYLKAVNANGDSSASSASSSVYIGYPSVTGGTLSSDSTYYYRTFTGNGNLVVSSGNVTADALMVAGGGAGGSGSGGGGGGGAGGLIYISGKSISPNTYSIVVGGGSPIYTQSTGSNTTFSTTTAYGGGTGGNGNDQTGSSGGSGGGAGRDNGNAGSKTQTSNGDGTGYGNNGGNSSHSGYGGGGGGGGAGAVGGNGSGNGSPSGETGGSGGAGLNTWSSWATATSTGDSGYYAGGGACQSIGSSNHGTRGLGGGGTAIGGNGMANTGGGGGSNGGAGGSGIVIFRYLKSAVGG